MLGSIAHRVLERGNDVADHAPTLFVEDLQADEMRGGCDPSSCSAAVVTVAGDHTGDMGTVTVVVVSASAAIHEVDEVDDALIAAGAGRAAGSRGGEIVVPGCDPRVDHRDANAGTVVAVRLLNCACADHRAHCRHRRQRRAVFIDAGNDVERRELLQLAVREFDNLPVDQLQAPAETTAEARQLRRVFLTVPRDDCP